MRIVCTSGIALLTLACAGWGGPPDDPDRSTIPSLDPVRVQGPAPALSADCATFGGISVPVAGGEAEDACDPEGASARYRHPAPSGAGRNPRGIAESLVARYASPASSAGWIRAPGDDGIFRYRHADHPGCWLQIDATSVPDEIGWRVTLSAHPAQP